MSGPESRSTDRSWLIWWILCVLWACGVLILSSIRGDFFPRLDIPLRLFGVGMDKVVHFGLFLVGGFLLTGALRQSFNWTWRRLFLVTFISLALFGASDEIHQLFTPHRSGADVGDWIADTLGGVAGLLLLYLAYGIRLFRKRCATHLLASTGN